jgi:MFS family permease
MPSKYGWVIVAYGALATCISLGCLMSLGVFLVPMATSTGWTRAGISGAATIGFVCMALGSIAFGALSDKFGTRIVVQGGALLLGIGLMLASQMTSVLAFQFVFGISVGFACGSVYVPVTTAAASWFTRNRSIAVALVSAGMGLGSTLIGPLSQAIMNHYDWRIAMFSLSLLAFGVMLPGAFLLRPAPAAAVADPAAAAAADSSETATMTASQAFRTPQFAALALANCACCMAHSGPIFHMVSYASLCGLSSMTAVSVFGTAGLAGVGGRLLLGVAADRFGAQKVLVAGLIMQAAMISLYPLARDAASLYLLAVLFGMAYGGVMPLYALLVREFFSSRIMGTLFGAVSMAATFGMALGPVVGGWLFDRFSGYVWLYMASSGIGVAAVAIACLIRPPRLSVTQGATVLASPTA